MKVLFDHNVPHKLRHSLSEHEVSTADEKGWAELENGELLRAAENASFDVLVTADQNLPHQQNLAGRNLGVVVLSTNNWNILKHAPREVATAVEKARPGSFQLVVFTRSG